MLVKGETILFCDRCELGHTTTHKRREISKVSQNYNENYIIEYAKRSSEVAKRFTTGIKFIRNYFRTRKKKISILDVGCGIGFFLKLLTDDANDHLKYLNLYGIEPNKTLAREAKRNCPKAKISDFSIEQSKFDNNHFDVITFWDVLEHVYNPIKTIKKTHNLLKKGGILIVQAPNYKSLMRVLTGKNWDWWLAPDHLYHFSPKSIRLLLENNEFDILQIETRESQEIFIKNAKAQIKGTSILTRLTRKIYGMLIYFVFPVIQFFTRTTKTGGLLFIIAQKR